MTKLKKGVTTPKSVEASKEIVGSIVRSAESSALRAVNASKLGRKSSAEFVRILSISTPKTGDVDKYVIIKVCEGPKLIAKKSTAKMPMDVESLAYEYASPQYLNPGQTSDDLDHSKLVTLASLVTKYKDTGNIAEEFYYHRVSIFSNFVEEQPTEDWPAVNIVDNEGNMLHQSVYIKKYVVRLDGTEVTQE